MKTIRINGVDYPFRTTMGAMLRFRREHGRDLSELDQTDIEGLLKFIWCCVKSASSADGVTFDLSFEQFADALTPETFGDICAEMNGEQKKTLTTVQP